MERRSWVVTVGARTYVWPHGAVVHLYGSEEYVRRLAREVRDASPVQVVPVSRFQDYESFREGCQADHREREAASAPPLPPKPLGLPLTGDLRAI